MKNIFLGLIFAAVLLPQVSFATADPQWITFIKSQDVEAQAFFAGQGNERGAFIQQHPDIIAKTDSDAKAWADHHQPGTTMPPPSDATLVALTQKQLADKLAFLSKLNQDRQAFLAAHPGISTN